MSHKKRGQLTTSGEWARHLRPFFRRLFWRGERRAARDLIQSEVHEPSANVSHCGSVEALLAEVAAWSSSQERAELWVPAELMLRSEPVSQEIAMAVVTDKVLAAGFMPAGRVARAGGWLYAYVRE